jgi:hypothetical protein
MDNRGITQKDIENMMNSNNDGSAKGESKEQTEEEKKLMQEWEQHMHDFIPEDISTIVVDPRKEVVSIRLTRVFKP